MADLFDDDDAPRSPLFSTRTIAALLKLSERELANLAGENVIPREGPGRFSLVGAVHGYIDYLRGRARPVEDLLFSQQEIAALLGISTQAFAKWGVPSKEKRGRLTLYYWPDVLAERDRRYHPKPTEDSGYDARYEQAREHRARADNLELEFAIKSGEVAYVADFAEAFGRAISAFRARLRGAGVKLAALVNPENPKLARDLIDKEHDEALAELADFDIGDPPGDGDGELGSALDPAESEELAERPADDRRDDVDPAAAAAVDGQPVGRRRTKT